MSKILTRFLLLSILCLISGHAHAEVQKISFDCDPASFKEERKILRQQYAKEYSAIKRAASEEMASGGNAYFKDRDFCIAKTDLDQDGTDDIFLYSGPGGLACGTAGCATNAYLIGKDGEWANVLSVYTYASGVFLTDIVNGYRTLKISQKIPCPCDTAIHPDGTKTLMNTEDATYIFDVARKRYREIGKDQN